MCSKYLVCLILLTIISGCASRFNWVPVGINTYTSRRIMDGAANYIGLSLVRELFALKKIYEPLYSVTFEGRRPLSKMIHSCSADVHEFDVFRPTVLAYECYPPLYYPV